MKEKFAELVREGILSLPQDLKTVLRIVDDPDIDDDSRVTAAGAVMHVLSASNSIPGMRGILGHVDDVLVLRLALERIEQKNPEAMAAHREDSPELFADLDDQLEVIRGYLGELTKVLEKAVDGLGKLNHQGHPAARCVRDTDAGNWLHDAVQEAIVEQIDFDDDEVAREVKGVDRILPHLRTRLQAM
ncbi:MAG TPA: hypothetical protein RMF84_16640 [Polyangiaceae bacterium LLY-WYZ-14_1]|jgi:uncharacterized membrane protein YkvA (DUF1232 family)|nr:hypothetical protein [Polyangiaceae bacterium LLY-WYZ-14_1]